MNNRDEFNESSDWTTMLEKKKAYYKRMEDDFDFRMEQVDKKLHTMNALSGGDYNRYVRYKTTIHDTLENVEYEIGLKGEFKEYKANNKKQY